MSDKYIIKNCPCYVQYENSLHLCCDGQGDGECQDVIDCILKQIVEKCKEHPLCDCACGDDILQLLQIEEVE